MRRFAATTKALSESNRVRAPMALEGGELCVCQTIEPLGLAPSTVSKHMSVLQQAGLVESRKEGRWVYCRLAGRGDAVVRGGLSWLGRALKDDERIRADARLVERIRTTGREKFCVRHSRGRGRGQVG